MCCNHDSSITYLVRRKGLNPPGSFSQDEYILAPPGGTYCTAFLSVLSLDRVEVLKFPERTPLRVQNELGFSFTYQKNTTSDSQMLSLCLFDNNHPFRCMPKHVQMANVCIV